MSNDKDNTLVHVADLIEAAIDLIEANGADNSTLAVLNQARTVALTAVDAALPDPAPSAML